MDDKPALVLPAAKGDVQDDVSVLSSKHLGEVTREITKGFVNSLHDLSSIDKKEQCSLLVPANVLLYLGSLLVLASFVFRSLPRFMNSFELGDFIASLGAGSFLLAVGAFLFWFQYRTEQARSAGTLKAAERVAAEGLVATLGAVKPSPPAKTFTP